MKAPLNRRVYVIGYGAATPLGATFEATWKRAILGETGFRKVSRFEVDSLCNVVGEVPDWDPRKLDFSNEKEAYNWNAAFIHLTMSACQEALQDADLPMDEVTGPRTACLVGSSLNGHDAFRIAMESLATGGPNKVSSYLLPNLCANLPASKAGMLLGFTGPVFSTQGACASANQAIGVGARMIRDGDCDFVLAGGVDAAILPEIIHGFANMNATIKVKETDRAWNDPGKASRPFSLDRKGFVLSEGAGVLVLAAEEAVVAHGLFPRAEILGVGWTSDAHHFTRPHRPTIVQCMRMAIEDAGLEPEDIHCVNAHGTSTPKGDGNEITCLREVFREGLQKIPIVSNKSQIGHTLGAAAAIEGALAIESMLQGVLLPTVNYIEDPEFADLDFVPHVARKQLTEMVISNAFGFGGSNCCIVFRGL